MLQRSKPSSLHLHTCRRNKADWGHSVLQKRKNIYLHIYTFIYWFAPSQEITFGIWVLCGTLELPGCHLLQHVDQRLRQRIWMVAGADAKEPATNKTFFKKWPTQLLEKWHFWTEDTWRYWEVWNGWCYWKYLGEWDVFGHVLSTAKWLPFSEKDRTHCKGFQQPQALRIFFGMEKHRVVPDASSHEWMYPFDVCLAVGKIDFASFRPLNPMFTSTFCINMPCESVVNLSINTIRKVVHKWPSAFFSYSARSFLATRWLVPARRVSSGSWPYVILSACHFSIDYVWQREKELTGYWQLVCKCFNWILRCLLYFLYMHIDSWKLGLLDIHSYKKIWYHPLSYWFAICCLGLGLLDDIGRRELEAAALQGEQTVWHRNDETYASQS